MKRIIILLLLLFITPLAQADEIGGWVRVDANGIPVGGVEVCAQSVCGDANSEFSKAVLGAGERYVKQTNATPDGNVAGYAPQKDVSVRVDLETNDWTIISRNKRQVLNTEVTQESILTINPNKIEPTTTSIISVPQTFEELVSDIDPFFLNEQGLLEPNPEFWEQWFWYYTGLTFTFTIN